MLPWNMAFLLGGLQSVPMEQVEAAHINGANNWQTFWQVILPSMKQTAVLIFVMGLISTLQHFDLPWTMTQVTDMARRTLGPGLVMTFLGEASTNWGYMMAASIVSAVPVTIIFVFLQRYFIQGLTSCAVKG